MRKFTDVLEEYLDEYNRQNSDYYHGRFIGDSTKGRLYLEDLAKELNEMVQGVNE